MAGGLIPLLLPFGGSHSRSSSTASTPTCETQRLSLPPAPSPYALPPSLPSTLTSPNQHKRQLSLPTQRPQRRPSFSMPSSLTTRQPQTAAEWRRAVAEVKRKYVSRKYRACWTRCCELLDGLEQQQQQQELQGVKEETEQKEGHAPTTTTTTEAEKQQPESPLVVYRIYLHFYAASSFEMGARPLSPSSPFRGQLLRDARSHYDRAAALIEATEEAAVASTQETRSRSGSASALALLANPAASKSTISSPSLNLSFSAASLTFLNSPSFISRSSSCASVVSSGSSVSAPSSPRTSLCSSLDGGESLNNKPASAAPPISAMSQNQNQNQSQDQAQQAATNNKPPQKLKKKKVSFSGLPELAADTSLNNRDSDNDTNSPRTPREDPCVRPDSPTLGYWEEDMVNTRQQRSKQQSALISSPSPSSESAERCLQPQQAGAATNDEKRRPPKPALSRLITDTTTTTTRTTAAAAASSSEETADPSSPRSPASANPSPSSFDLESFLQAKSLGRVCAQLSSLRSQIRWHRDAVDSLLHVPDETPQTPAFDTTPVHGLASAVERPRPDSMAIPIFPDVPLSAAACASAFARRGSVESVASSSRASSRSRSGSSAGFENRAGSRGRQPRPEAYSTATAEDEMEIDTSKWPVPRSYSRSSSRAESRLRGYSSGTPTRAPTPSSVISNSTSASVSPASSSLYHSYAFPLPTRPGTSMALSSPITRLTTPTIPSCKAPPPPPKTGGAAHSYSNSYSQRPGTSMSMAIGSSIRRPASAASVRSNGSVRDEGIQQRIERLRASGWQRKRFDTRRYEALRESVLGELAC